MECYVISYGMSSCQIQQASKIWLSNCKIKLFRFVIRIFFDDEVENDSNNLYIHRYLTA